MKRICFGITKLDLGGAERVLVDIANKICFEYEVTILTIYFGGELEKELNPRVKIENIFERQTIFTPAYSLLFGKKIYNKFLKNKYDIEVAFLEGSITRIFSNKGIALKYAWVHNDISKVFGEGKKAKLKKQIDKNVYKRFDRVIFVSEDNKKVFNTVYKDVMNQEVIYNYIDKERVLKKANEKVDNIDFKLNGQGYKTFLTVARLVKQKGIDRLIRVHKRLIDEGYWHKIYVIGDGPEKNNLQGLIKRFNVQDSFILLGKKENPYPYMKLADYFVLLSYFEGYGMVLEEAKILNKNILITDTAAKEAVQKYDKCKIFENNEKAIYLGLKEVIE